MNDLPAGWVSARLEDIGMFNPKHGRDVPDDLPVSFVPMAAVSDSLGEIETPQVRPYGTIKKGFTHFQTGDVIFAKITPCMENGKIAVARQLQNDLACGTTEFHVIRPAPGVSAELVWRFLRQKSFRSDAEHSMTGAVGQRRVPVEYLKKSAFPLPPLPEQRRIVAKIDSLTGKSKRARDHLDHIPRLVEKYKQAVLTAAFRGDLANVPIGTPQMFSSVTTVRTGPFGSALHKSDYISGGVPLVNPMHIKDGRIVHSKDMSVTEEKAQELVEYKLVEGDVVLARRGVMGRCAVVTQQEGGFLCGTGSMIVRPSSALLPLYLQRYLSSPDVVAALEDGAVGTTMVNLNQSVLLRQVIPLPSMEGQQEIVRRIEHLFAWIDRLAAEAISARKLVDRLDQAVLAKAFRGELVPQDPNDEPASALLERIRSERASTAAAKPKHKAKK